MSACQRVMTFLRSLFAEVEELYICFISVNHLAVWSLTNVLRRRLLLSAGELRCLFDQKQNLLSSVQVSGKRTVLLSNEARREMAKQARAMKEERRATLDARHKYLISRLVDAGTLGEPEVEDALISDDKVPSGPVQKLSEMIFPLFSKKSDQLCLTLPVFSD